MTETRIVVACATCQVCWGADDEPEKCADPEHEHQQFEVHRHHSAVALPDGTVIIAVSFDASDPYARDQSPDYGLYLDRQWQPPWPHDHIDWPDFGIPNDSASLVTMLGPVLDRARLGERIDVGCLGGHGRTGNSLGMPRHPERPTSGRGDCLGSRQLLRERR